MSNPEKIGGENIQKVALVDPTTGDTIHPAEKATSSNPISAEISTNGEPVSVQNPLQTNGGSVHAENIDTARSEMNNFSGLVTDLFDNLHSIVKDVTSNAKKELFVHFERTETIMAFGLGNSEGANNPDAPDFKNTKIIGLNSGGGETVLVDESADSTPYSDRTFRFSPAGFNGIKLEFHTADPVGLTNFFIPKTQLVASRSLTSVSFVENAVWRFLENTGSRDMDVDGSGTPIDFIAASSALSFLERSFIALKDGTGDFVSTNFGSISGGLTNGVDVIIESDGVEYLLANWKTNYDIALSMYDFMSPFKDGAYIGRWTFSKDTGQPYAMRPGDKFIIRINDNLTGLDLFQFQLKGHF